MLLIIGTASAFSRLMAYHQVPAALIDWMQGISDDPIVILLFINLILLLLGTFMDMGPTIVITTPIFLPIAEACGIDPVQFGVIMVLNCGIGLNTPPVGAEQFVTCAVGKISVGESMKTIWPFYGAGFAVLMLVTYVPTVSLWLPSLFRQDPMSHPVVTTGPGVSRQVLSVRPELMVVASRFAEGGVGALHSHPHVQATYVVAGRFRFTVDGAKTEVGPGDGFVIPVTAPRLCVSWARPAD